MDGGPLWRAMHARPRHRGSELLKADIPTNPAVYAWYRRDAAIYLGKADRLQDRLWKNHLGQGPVMTGSAFRRNVAEHLGISTATRIKARTYQPDTHEVARVRRFIEGCQLAWLVCETKSAPLDLETRMKREWLPPLTKR